jgi:6,7-dimethyl-8-ribityllumazine synthase
MTGYFEDTGDWPFREAAPVRQAPEPEPALDPEPALEPEPQLELGAERDVVAPTRPEPVADETTPVPGAEALEEPGEAEAAESEELEVREALEEPEAFEEPRSEVGVAEEEEALEEPEAFDEPETAFAVPVAEHAEGELDIPDGYRVLDGTPSGERRTVAVVAARFNGEITNGLLRSALDQLDEAGVPRDAVTIMPVPGAFELPLAAMALAKTRRYACVVAIGCVIRGETPHFDFVASEAASGLQLAAIETGVPVSFGLLTCETREQAEARVGKGAEAVRAALEMADLFAKLRVKAAAR